MQEMSWLSSSILHITNYVHLGQQLTLRRAQKPILPELECGSVKCGNTSWSSFVSLSVRVSAHTLGMQLKIVCFLYFLFRSLARPCWSLSCVDDLLVNANI